MSTHHFLSAYIVRPTLAFMSPISHLWQAPAPSCRSLPATARRSHPSLPPFRLIFRGITLFDGELLPSRVEPGPDDSLRHRFSF